MTNVIPKDADAEIAELDVLKVQTVKHVFKGYDYEVVSSGLALVPVSTKPGESYLYYPILNFSTPRQQSERFHLLYMYW